MRSVTVLGSDGDPPVAYGGLDARHHPRAGRVRLPTARPTGELGAVRARLAAPLDRRVVLAVLLDPDPREAVQARHLDQARAGVEPLVLQRLRAQRDEGGHQVPDIICGFSAGSPCGSPSSSAFLRRLSATSSCQNSLARVVSTSNSKRSTISGAMSALST